MHIINFNRNMTAEKGIYSKFSFHLKDISMENTLLEVLNNADIVCINNKAFDAHLDRALIDGFFVKIERLVLY